MSALTITRRMDAVFNGLDDKFNRLYNMNDFKREIAKLKAAENKSNRPSILQNLYCMFDDCNIKYMKGKDALYYEEIVNDTYFPTFEEIEKQMIYSLYTEYQKYPSSEDYLLRVVNKMTFSDDNWITDTLRVRILKQFIKYGNYLSDADYGGKAVIQKYVKAKLGKKPIQEEVINTIADDIFDNLLTAAGEMKKPGGKYGLLKLTDDLANGKFRSGGATKRGLYLFAMVYGMTYYSQAADELLDYESDIEKNLFQDYYANNLFQFVSDNSREKLSQYELDPSGKGINYKNFAEMVYIYFLSQDYTPAEKIKRATEMIKRIQKKQLGQTMKKNTAEEKTEKFKQHLYSEDFLKMPEPEFEAYLCSNYDCNTLRLATATEKAHSISVMQLASEQNTAFEHYQRICQDLTELKVDLKTCNYGLWFTDVAAFKKNGCKDICEKWPEIDEKIFAEFIEVLSGINRFLGCTVNETRSELSTQQEWSDPLKRKTKALYVSSPKAMTRTSLIVAYYYFYNAENVVGWYENKKSFAELFLHFKEKLDQKLIESGYQTFSGKNIFDVLVVFSTYAYLNI